MVRRTVRAESLKCSWSLVDDSLIDAEKFCFLSRAVAFLPPLMDCK
jgi:hypothetical protein